MKALILYDSVYGNTEKIANAIGAAITPYGGVKVLRAGDADLSELESGDLLIIGSPTHGGRPTPAIQDLLKKALDPSLQGVNVAVFDTRVSARWVKIFGYAAGKIAGHLRRSGRTLIASPEGFFVRGKEGPLKDGEQERAAGWARRILESKK